MELSEFLVKAKIRTYASEGESGERILPDGCKELTYAEDDFRYRDRYFGGNSFVGEEVVWRGEQAVWGMNYYGVVFDAVHAPGEIYHFLKDALKQVTVERPFRGPRSFQEHGLAYVDESSGTLLFPITWRLIE